MKKRSVFLSLLSLCVAVLGSSTFVQADLVNNGNGLIYDTVLNITWYDYAKSPDTWDHQVSWAASLSVTDVNGHSITGWRLPTAVDGPYVVGYDGTTTAGWNITTSELGHLFYIGLDNKGKYDASGNLLSVYGLMNNTSYSFRVRSYGKSDSGSDAYSSYSNTASATTANYALRYVSTSGNNANDGKTPSTAWRNISYAGQTATAGMVVYVMGGSYANDYLNTANSGSMGNKIVFQAYPGNTVMLTSGSTSGGHNVQINGSYIVVDGIKSNHDSVDYAWANYGSRNAVVNCESGLQGTTQRAGMSTLGAYNIIHNSFFHDGGTGPSGNDPGYICSVMGAGANHNGAKPGGAVAPEGGRFQPAVVPHC